MIGNQTNPILLINQIRCITGNVFIFLKSLVSVPSALGEFCVTDGPINYGEISSEWHEGSPDWAFGPPTK